MDCTSSSMGPAFELGSHLSPIAVPFLEEAVFGGADGGGGGGGSCSSSSMSSPSSASSNLLPLKSVGERASFSPSY